MNKIDKAVCKIVARIEEETGGIDLLIQPHISLGSASPKPPMDTSTFESISMAADEVRAWADRLSNFAAMAAEGETDLVDWDEFVPTC